MHQQLKGLDQLQRLWQYYSTWIVLQVLEALQALLQQQLEGLDQLLGMRGMLEHIRCRAPLPTGQSMAVATYSIEVLDLRVL